jgi:methylmalonyl-CoA/ethylmalonyl-CoA epimerase
METEPGLGRIGQIALRVGDVAAATEYYRDVLGLPFLFSAPPGMAFFDCDGTRLLLGEPEPGSEPADEPAGGHGTILYFRVRDIRSAHRVLVERTVEFVEDPRQVADMGDHTLWLAFFRDPWSNTLALMSEVPKTPDGTSRP